MGRAESSAARHRFNEHIEEDVAGMLEDDRASMARVSLAHFQRVPAQVISIQKRRLPIAT
jgi:hypothetical protein